MVKIRSILLMFLMLFVASAYAAISPSALFTLDAAQTTTADSLEAELDVALQAQAAPGESAFAVEAANTNLDDDALVRSEVAQRYSTAGWTTAAWQNAVGTNAWVLILIE